MQRLHLGLYAATQGSVPYVNASANLAALAPGTSGYLLASQGAGADPVWVAPSSGGVTLDGAYDFGGAGAGRSITVDSDAVRLLGDAADNNNVLEISKSPAGAQSGNALDVTMGSNATGWAARALHTALSASTAYTAGGYNARYGDIQARGILLENSTAAVDGTRLQNSPAAYFRAHAFDTIADVDRTLDAAINLTAIVDNTAGSLDVPYPRLDFWVKGGGAGATLDRIFSIAGEPFFAGLHIPHGYPIHWYDPTDPGYSTGMGRLSYDGTEFTVDRSLAAHDVMPAASGTYSLGESSTPRRWAGYFGQYTDLLQAAGTGTPPHLVLAVGGAHTGMNNAEQRDVHINLGQSKQWTGSSSATPWSIAAQRAYRISAPTYTAANNNGIVDPEGGGTNGGVAFTQVATFAISGAPSISTNAACSSLNRYALWIESGISQFDGMVKPNNQSTVGGDIRLQSRTGNPSTLANGDLWYRSDTGALHFRHGGATLTLSTSAGGVTLDGAYDFGGAGAGRSITVDSGAVALTNDAANGNNVLEIGKSPAGSQSGSGISVTMGANATGSVLAATAANSAANALINVSRVSVGATDPLALGIMLRNTTAAAAGAQQNSPDIHLSGAGWKTDATAASQPVDWQMFVRPVQGTANPSSVLVFNARINNGTSNQRLGISSGGQLLGNDGAVTAPTYSYASAPTTGHYLNGALLDTVIAGTQRMSVSASRVFLNISGSAGTPAIQINDTNSGFTGGADSIGISIGGAHYLLLTAAAGIVANKNAYSTPVVLTDGATVNVDALLSNKFTWTAAGNRTLANATNVVAGMEWQILYRQDGTGGRTVDYDTNYVGPDNVNPDTSCQPNTTANAYTILSFQAISSTKIMVSKSSYYI